MTFEKIKDAKDCELKHNGSDHDRPTTSNSQRVYDFYEAMRTMEQTFFFAIGVEKIYCKIVVDFLEAWNLSNLKCEAQPLYF